MKVSGCDAVYHCMSRTVNGEFLFKDREKEILRKMIRQIADFCGVEVLTYCILSNHFHVLVRVPVAPSVSDAELLRRYRVLYPKPTKYQEASVQVIESQLQADGEEADVIRRRLLARMSDVSEFMKTLKQRFTTWYNKSHQRYGTLWADRFKSVLVEGRGNPLQTMAAYIDLNPVRAGLVKDPKDYRFCGYAEAVGNAERPTSNVERQSGETFEGRITGARAGLLFVWSDSIGVDSGVNPIDSALRAHRSLIFGKRASEPGVSEMTRQQALKVLEQDGMLTKSEMLRCRVRYFSDGAILGSVAFVSGFTDAWQAERGRKYPPRVNALRGSGWGDLSVIQGLRRQVFG